MHSQKYTVSDYQATYTSTPEPSYKINAKASSNQSSARNSSEITVTTNTLNTSESDRMKRSRYSWLPIFTAGILASIFLGCMITFPGSPIHLNGISQSYGSKTKRQGKLVVYPKVEGIVNDTVPDRYFINLSPSHYQSNINALNKLAKSYPSNNTEPYVHCWLDIPTPERPCLFDFKWLNEECSNVNKYGYKNSNNGYIKPCFAVRIENSGSWIPTNIYPYQVLMQHKDEYDPSFIGLECRALDFNDRTWVSFDRHPVKGFALQFFPMNKFSNETYLHPVVMVQMMINKSRPIKDLTIECWLRCPNAFNLTDSGSFRITFTNLTTSDSYMYLGLKSHQGTVKSNVQEPKTLEVSTEKLMESTPKFNETSEKTSTSIQTNNVTVRNLVNITTSTEPTYDEEIDHLYSN